LLNGASVRAIVEATALPLKMTITDLTDRLWGALNDHDLRVAFSPARQREREARRVELLSAMHQLQTLMADELSMEALDMIVVAGINKSIRDGRNRNVSVPVGDLSRSLRGVEMALRESLSDRGQEIGESDRGTLEPPTGLPALIGDLGELYQEAYRTRVVCSNRGEPGQSDAPFERFARGVLAAAGVLDSKGGSWRESTVYDAWKTYRRGGS
jgi:hypothetical protein